MAGDIFRNRLTRIVFTSVLFLCMIYANFYAIRKMERYALELYLYEKLLSAYEIASAQGMQKELSMVASDASMPREAKLARQFQARLPGIKDPYAYLKDIAAQKMNKLRLLKKLRTIAIIVIFLLAGYQFLAGRRKKA